MCICVCIIICACATTVYSELVYTLITYMCTYISMLEYAKKGSYVALFPGPHTASDGKLGEGLGTRLEVMYRRVKFHSFIFNFCFWFCCLAAYSQHPLMTMQ